MIENIADNVARIRENIVRAAYGRDIKLIGVTKTVVPERIADAFHAGVNIFGENRIQEALPKIETLNSLAADWHFIGHLQTNKARDAVHYFSWIHSINSSKLLMNVEKEASKQQKNIDLMLELNLGDEETKHGMRENELPEILRASSGLQWCKIRGLMIIPPFQEDAEKIRPYFQKLRRIQEHWQKDFPGLTELSMGMSHDYEIAIEEGATMVRIGTAIFGERR